MLNLKQFNYSFLLTASQYKEVIQHTSDTCDTIMLNSDQDLFKQHTNIQIEKIKHLTLGRHSLSNCNLENFLVLFPNIKTLTLLCRGMHLPVHSTLLILENLV